MQLSATGWGWLLRPMAEQARRQEEHRAQERKQRLERDADKAEGERQQPDKRPQDERQKCQWPAQGKEKAPSNEREESSHGVRCVCAMVPGRARVRVASRPQRANAADCSAKVGFLVEGADLDLAWTRHGVRAALHPSHGFIHVFDLPAPDAGHQVLRVTSSLPGRLQSRPSARQAHPRGMSYSPTLARPDLTWARLVLLSSLRR